MSVCVEGIDNKNVAFPRLCRLLHNCAAYRLGLQYGVHIIEPKCDRDVTRFIHGRDRDVVQGIVTDFLEHNCKGKDGTLQVKRKLPHLLCLFGIWHLLARHDFCV